MKAALLKGINSIEIEDYKLRKLKNDEVLVQVKSCGICGTDKHIFEGKAPSKVPVILGHEYSGVVVEKSKSTKFEIGDRVAVDPNIFCGNCIYCRQGKVNFCSNLQALGVTQNGGFAEYSIVPNSQLHLIPQNMDFCIGAFAEPLSCCIRGINNSKIKNGETVVIIGGGTIGLLFVQLVRMSGASKIILIEPVLQKRELGLKFGADYVLNPKKNNFLEELNEITYNDVNLILECVGNKETVDLAIKIVTKGTRIVIFGLAPNDHYIQINLQHLFHNEVTIINSLLNPFTFQDAVKLLVSNRVKVDCLISNKYSLNQLPKIITSNNAQFIKNQIIINYEEAA